MRIVVLVLAIVAAARDARADEAADYHDRCVGPELLEPSTGIAPVCFMDGALDAAERKHAVRRLAGVAVADRPAFIELLLELAMTEPDLRRVAKRVLRKLGVRRALIRQIPTERAVRRWLAKVLPRRGLADDEVCGFDLVIERDALVLTADDGYCADGSFVGFRARIGAKRWKLLDAYESHTG
jgi:hypothetical protein